MQQGDDYYDDDYYDDDYEDDEGSSSGPGMLVVLLVGLVLFMGLGAIGLAAFIVVHQSGSGDGSGDATSAEDSTPAPPADTPPPLLSGVETAVASGDEGGGELPAAEAEVELPSDPPPASSTAAASPASRPSRGASDASSDSTRTATSPRYEAPSARAESSDDWRRSSDSGRSSSRRSDPTPRERRSDSTSSSEGRIRISADSSTSSSSSSSSSSGSSSSSSEDSGMAPGTIIDGDSDSGSSSSSSSSGSSLTSYERSEIAALGQSAKSGGLDRDDVDHLKKIPSSNKNFTLAWSTVLKNAEAKRNYREHCNAAQRIMSLPQNKYHPEWNLEMAKCQMRNRQWSAAIKSSERTLSDTYGMTAKTKSKRVLLAHEIRAKCKTQIYEKDAKSNAGMSDEAKLRSAIQAWREYKTYARGINNTRGLQRADKEIGDLEARKQ